MNENDVLERKVLVKKVLLNDDSKLVEFDNKFRIFKKGSDFVVQEKLLPDMFSQLYASDSLEDAVDAFFDYLDL